jgi:hypothetical protein
MDEADVEKGIFRIRELAAWVVERFRPLSEVDFGLNRASVQWLEGFIERQRPRRDPIEGVPEGLVNTLGAFLGECLAAATGGAWEWDEQRQDWSIRFASGACAFPFAKVGKQFANGLESGDSILSFYDVAVEYIASGKLEW